MEKSIAEFLSQFGETTQTEVEDALGIINDFCQQYQQMRVDNEKAKIAAEKAEKKKQDLLKKGSEVQDGSKKGKQPIQPEGEGLIDVLFNSIKAGNFKLRRANNNPEITAV